VAPKKKEKARKPASWNKLELKTLIARNFQFVMKVITVNFITCAVKACKTSASSFPLHFQDVEVEQQDVHFEPAFIQNLLPRIEWTGLRTTAIEVFFSPSRASCYVLD
jgi:hypothetical protein